MAAFHAGHRAVQAGQAVQALMPNAVLRLHSTCARLYAQERSTRPCTRHLQGACSSDLQGAIRIVKLERGCQEDLPSFGLNPWPSSTKTAMHAEC